MQKQTKLFLPCNNQYKEVGLVNVTKLFIVIIKYLHIIARFYVLMTHGLNSEHLKNIAFLINVYNLKCVYV